MYVVLHIDIVWKLDSRFLLSVGMEKAKAAHLQASADQSIIALGNRGEPSSSNIVYVADRSNEASNVRLGVARPLHCVRSTAHGWWRNLAGVSSSS